MFKFNRRQRFFVWWLLRFATLLGGSSTAGCRESFESRLEGRWLGEGVENIPDAQVAGAVGFVRGLSFEFSGSNLTVTIPADSPRSSHYKILSEQSERVRIGVDRHDGRVDVAELSFAADDSLRWHIAPGQSVLMRKE